MFSKRNKKYIIFIGILLVVCIIIYVSLFTIEEFNKDKKNAIVILTRGYDDMNKYNLLINRNTSIYEVFYSKLENKNNYDIIIFHEGNITTNAQDYIQNKTPNMNLQFIPINFHDTNVTSDLCPQNEVSSRFNSGYKNMCYFWSIDYLEYLKDYEYIIRLDEDCILQKMDENIIENYKKRNIIFSSSYFQGDDDPKVIIGLKDLFESYIKENNLTKKTDKIKCPYTNFMIVNIPYFKNNKIIQDVLKKIKESNCIFSNRWGDLPIFGYILTYLVDPNLYYEDKTIKYYHGSHDMQINN